jgi:hypothetical protein
LDHPRLWLGKAQLMPPIPTNDLLTGMQAHLMQIIRRLL